MLDTFWIIMQVAAIGYVTWGASLSVREGLAGAPNPRLPQRADRTHRFDPESVN